MELWNTGLMEYWIIVGIEYTQSLQCTNNINCRLKFHTDSEAWSDVICRVGKFILAGEMNDKKNYEKHLG